MGFKDRIRNYFRKPKYICENCGKKFNSKIELLNHTHVISQDLQQVQFENNQCEKQDGPFLCKLCGRRFATENGLQNHVHHDGDLIAAPDPNPRSSHDISPQKTGIDTQFVNQREVNMTNLGSERLRYDKFPGKIGYIRRK